jgi:hypothetical protein
VVYFPELFDDAMSSIPTIQQDEPKLAEQARESRFYTHLFWPGLIFVCGCLVGAGVTVTLIEHRMFSMMTRPAPEPQQIILKLASELVLDSDQTRKVAAIVFAHDPHVRRHLQELDTDRKRFEAEIAAVLNEDQKHQWQRRCEEMQKLFPPPPSAAP